MGAFYVTSREAYHAIPATEVEELIVCLHEDFETADSIRNTFTAYFAAFRVGAHFYLLCTVPLYSLHRLFYVVKSYPQLPHGQPSSKLYTLTIQVIRTSMTNDMVCDTTYWTREEWLTDRSLTEGDVMADGNGREYVYEFDDEEMRKRVYLPSLIIYPF